MKAFNYLCVDSAEQTAVSRAVQFINNHDLQAGQYHLIPVPQPGPAWKVDINIIYHAERALQ